MEVNLAHTPGCMSSTGEGGGGGAGAGVPLGSR